MWYIFPQAAGLGYSATSRRYAIQSLDEAQRLFEASRCWEAACGNVRRRCWPWKTGRRRDIFGSPDEVKLQSSMTLFAQASEPDSLFVLVLRKYFDGQAGQPNAAAAERVQGA